MSRSTCEMPYQRFSFGMNMKATYAVLLFNLHCFTIKFTQFMSLIILFYGICLNSQIKEVVISMMNRFCVSERQRGSYLTYINILVTLKRRSRSSGLSGLDVSLCSPLTLKLIIATALQLFFIYLCCVP